MTDYTDALDQVDELKARTAGSLPGTRTFGMVTDALATDDIEAVKAELTHSRAHYQSLEYTLVDDKTNADIILEGIANGAYPEPTSVEDAIRLATRVFATGAIESAYDTAHSLGFFIMVAGMNLQEALQAIYVGLDWTDPERDLTEADIARLLEDAPPTD